MSMDSVVPYHTLADKQYKKKEKKRKEKRTNAHGTLHTVDDAVDADRRVLMY